MRLTSANSVNVGRLLPQSVYYFHAVAQLQALGVGVAQGSGGVAQGFSPAEIIFCTPSGNFGNITAGLMAKRAGLPIARFVAATNVNDVVPAYLETGRFEPRPSVATLSNAMDVGHPSNFERMLWLYGSDLEAMRRDVAGCRFTDDDVRVTIKRVYEERGYLLDPHSAIAYMGLMGQVGQVGRVGQVGQVGVFLSTAHPAKFAEIVEPIIGRPVEKPQALADALNGPQHIIRIRASLDRVLGLLDG
jgi:threonine synthase